MFFNLWPAHWGLKGSMLKRARIEYDYSAPEDARLRKEKLMVIDHAGDDLEIAKLALLLEYNEITKREFKEGLIAINYKEGSDELETAKNKLLLLYNDITKLEYEKRKSTLAKEPWVHGELHGDPDVGFYFEMDWNDLFLDYLSTLGFSGPNHEDVVDQWITRLYTNEFMLGEWESLKSEAEAGVTIASAKRSDGKTEHT